MSKLTPEDLVEIELIKRVKYAYFRNLDLKQWDEIAELFTDDATASYGGGAYAFEGRDAIVDVLPQGDGPRELPVEPQGAPPRDRAHRAGHRDRASGRSRTS